MTTAPPEITTRADREQARRERSRRQMAVSAVSTVVVVGGLATLVLTSPGWPVARRTFFSSYWFRKSFPSVLDGFWLDVRMFLIVEVVVLILGLLIALCRTVQHPVLFPLRILSIVFVDIMRGVPTLLVVYLFGFGIPTLGLSYLPSSPVVLAEIALSLNYSAYVSEVFRAGIQSIHPSQGGAALALGLTRTQALRYVIVPQAVRRVVPPLLNDFVALQKDVALVSVIGPQEVLRAAEINQALAFNFTPLIGAAILYLCITIPLTRVIDRMQERSRRERGAAFALGPR